MNCSGGSECRFPGARRTGFARAVVSAPAVMALTLSSPLSVRALRTCLAQLMDRGGHSGVMVGTGVFEVSHELLQAPVKRFDTVSIVRRLRYFGHRFASDN